MHRPVGLSFVRRTATFHIRTMHQLGYRQIGHGAFSRAFVHPDAPDVVVKVGSYRSRRFDSLFDAFADFAERILSKEIGSKFYPKIYDVRREGERHLVIMRRYDKPANPLRITRTIEATATKVTKPTTSPVAAELRRFGRAFKALANRNVLFDIHQGNIRQDHAGNPILIDPICYKL